MALIDFNSDKINTEKINRIGSVFKNTNGKYSFKIWFSGEIVNSQNFNTESQADTYRTSLINEVNLNLTSYVKYWSYQDFTLSNEGSTTLTLNENQNVSSIPNNIINSTAVLSDQNGKPVGTFLSRSEVSTHTGTSVILNQNVTGDIRIWWLQYGVPPAGMQQAPQFVNKQKREFLDSQFVNQIGDESISGTKTFTDQTNFTNDIQQTQGNYFYLGDKDTNGSWRFYNDGTDMLFEKRESDTWVYKGGFIA